MSSDTSSSGKRQIGCVKWFNNKTGFGFITSEGSDIFVHHSNVVVSSEQYKYLVQGEYVEFVVSHIANGTHSTQAGDVTGIQKGKLMCETRNEFRKVDSSDQQQEQQYTTNTRTVKRERSFNGASSSSSSGPNESMPPRLRQLSRQTSMSHAPTQRAPSRISTI